MGWIDGKGDIEVGAPPKDFEKSSKMLILVQNISFNSFYNIMTTDLKNLKQLQSLFNAVK